MRNQLGDLTPSEIEDNRATVSKLANSTRLAIRLVAGSLALLFAFLTLGDNWLQTGIDTANPDLVFKLGLFIYYTSWVFGSQFDVDIGEAVFYIDQERGNIGLNLILKIALFSVVSITLLSLHVYAYHKLFAVSLALFLAMNFWGWISICKRVRAPINSSIELYELNNDAWAVAKIRFVDEYMTGEWQRHRFVYLAFLMVLFCSATFLIPIFDFGERFSQVNVYGINGSKLIGIFPAFLFLLFVLAATISMWLKRAEATVQMQVLDKLRHSYAIEARHTEKKSEAEAPL